VCFVCEFLLAPTSRDVTLSVAVARYEDALTLTEARERYFAENGFDSGYRERFIHVRLLGRSLPVFPNTPARIAAAKLHDLHHVATEYDTSWTGEGEIGAFELASGCGQYLAAWVLDLTSFGIGCLISPRRIWRAFVRGRYGRTLYGLPRDGSRLGRSVGELRRELGLDLRVPGASRGDALAFGMWVLLVLLYASAGMLSLPLFLLAMFKMPREPVASPAARQDGSAAPAE
jgi:hypothetical protein